MDWLEIIGLHKFYEVIYALFYKQGDIINLLSSDNHSVSFLISTIILVSLAEYIGQSYLFILNKVKLNRLIFLIITLIGINIISALLYGLFVYILLFFFGVEDNIYRITLNLIAFSLLPRLLMVFYALPVLGEGVGKIIQIMSLYFLFIGVVNIWELPQITTLFFLSISYLILYVARQTSGKYFARFESDILNFVNGKPFEKYNITKLMERIRLG